MFHTPVQADPHLQGQTRPPPVGITLNRQNRPGLDVGGDRYQPLRIGCQPFNQGWP